jgi:hypothetical protein
MLLGSLEGAFPILRHVRPQVGHVRFCWQDGDDVQLGVAGVGDLHGSLPGGDRLPGTVHGQQDPTGQVLALASVPGIAPHHEDGAVSVAHDADRDASHEGALERP